MQTGSYDNAMRVWDMSTSTPDYIHSVGKCTWTLVIFSHGWLSIGVEWMGCYTRTWASLFELTVNLVEDWAVNYDASRLIGGRSQKDIRDRLIPCHFTVRKIRAKHKYITTNFTWVLVLHIGITILSKTWGTCQSLQFSIGHWFTNLPVDIWIFDKNANQGFFKLHSTYRSQ